MYDPMRNTTEYEEQMEKGKRRMEFVEKKEKELDEREWTLANKETGERARIKEILLKQMELLQEDCAKCIDQKSMLFTGEVIQRYSEAIASLANAFTQVS